MRSSKLDCIRSKLGRLGGRSESKKANADQKAVNKEINERLRRDKQEYRSTHRLLLLGTSNSGKTTILKQINVIGLSESQRRQKVLDIKKSLRDTVVSVASTMRNLKPSIKLQCVENTPHLDYMLTKAVTFNEEEQFADIFFDGLQALWRDEGFRKCYNLLEETHKIGCTSYFLDKVESIRNKNYRPADQDVIRCCLLKSGISGVKFSVAGVKFHIFEVGCQKDERKWIQCFNEITAILFIADSSGYDVMSKKDTSMNRLQEAMDFFNRIWKNRWLQNICVVLFLNKRDLLEKKLLEGTSSLEDHFPEFVEYVIPKYEPSCYGSRHSTQSYVEYSCYGNEHPEVNRVKCFIRDKFLRICQSGESRRYCYPHFTCGTDAENIRRLFSDCRDIIQRMHLRQYELL